MEVSFTLSIVMYAQQRSSDVQYGEIMKLASSGHRLHLYSEPYGLLTEIDEIQCDLLIIDLDAQDTKTLDLIARARHLKQQLYIVVIADSDQYAMAAMKIGVQDFLKKPVEIQTLGKIIQKVQSSSKNPPLTQH